MNKYVASLVAVTALAACEATPNQVDQPPTAQAGYGQEISVLFPSDNPGSRATLNYDTWSYILRSVVFYMGPSNRKVSAKPVPTTGSRLIYGHDSKFRLEGNRVRFSVVSNDMKAELSTYRDDLVRVGNEIQIAELSRNEQLAYWMNLHNAVVIDEISKNYPVKTPSRINYEPGDAALDDAKLVTIQGVALSPRDIREKIVYANWSDPKVMYGFFRGEIGGPSIQGIAFSAENVSSLLSAAAREYVNSLRGVELYRDDLFVSRIYHEARPYFFPDWPDDLKSHLLDYADEEVREEIFATSSIKEQDYETDIADLAGGDTSTPRSLVIDLYSGSPVEFGAPPQVQRLLREYDEKMDALRRQGKLQGRVIIIDEPDADEDTAEVD